MIAPLRVLVADDEALARTRLARLLAGMPDVELVAACADGDAVAAALRAHAVVDVLLLDIQMPGRTGLDVAALVTGGPRVVFCTAHAEHAARAFDLAAVDYVLKPVEPARLRLALERARAALPRTAAPPRLPLATRQGLVLVDPARVAAVWLDGALAVVALVDGARLYADTSLAQLAARLGEARLCRVHRVALVDLAAVERLEPLASGGLRAHLTGGHAVPVSREAARRLRRALRM